MLYYRNSVFKLWYSCTKSKIIVIILLVCFTDIQENNVEVQDSNKINMKVKSVQLTKTETLLPVKQVNPVFSFSAINSRCSAATEFDIEPLTSSEETEIVSCNSLTPEKKNIVSSEMDNLSSISPTAPLDKLPSTPELDYPVKEEFVISPYVTLTRGKQRRSVTRPVDSAKKQSK